MRIKISEDFSDTPGARYYSDGENSGQQFYEEILREKFKLAITQKSTLEIDFDDCYGFASSFISESFGRLSEEFGKDLALKTLILISIQDPILPEQIRQIVSNPNRDA